MEEAEANAEAALAKQFTGKVDLDRFVLVFDEMISIVMGRSDG